MSRTKRGSKAPGFEYWGKRPGNKHGQTPGELSKKFTHKKERQAAKNLMRNYR